jgi:hypothetical protein
MLFGLAGLVVETVASGEQSGEYRITPVEWAPTITPWLRGYTIAGFVTRHTD